MKPSIVIAFCAVIALSFIVGAIWGWCLRGDVRPRPASLADIRPALRRRGRK